MNLEWRIALRYLGSKRRRGIISVIGLIAIGGVFVGVAALVIVMSVMNGLQEDLREKILTNTPHLLIQKYNSEPIDDYQEVTEALRATRGVIGASPFIYTEGIIGHGRGRNEGAVIRGVDPRHEPDVADARDQVIAGDWDLVQAPDEPYPKVVVGYMLADRLGAFPGDTLTLTTPEVASVSPLHGTIPKLQKFVLAGTFKSGLFEYDSKFVYASLSALQEYLQTGDVAYGVAARVDDAWSARGIGDRVVQQLDGPFYVTTWIELNQPLFAALSLEKKAMFVILVLIVLVAAFNIISTLTMIVMDKTKEIGILRSMGMQGRAIRRVFVYQGALIGGVGTTLGCLAGLGAALLLARYRFISLPGEVYFIDTLPVSIDPLNIALIIGASLLISLAATLYPARQAAAMMPVDAIRYE
ncbi:MAG TPA: ABC transporter permease [Gemmatimonadota bacterium]|nr:ABC transporter permease [Gemmatimonadota bacterium]